MYRSIEKPIDKTISSSTISFHYIKNEDYKARASIFLNKDGNKQNQFILLGKVSHTLIPVVRKPKSYEKTYVKVFYVASDQIH